MLPCRFPSPVARAVCGPGWLGLPRAAARSCVRVAPAELGVGGYGQAEGSGCRPLPFLPVGHGPGEALFFLLVVVAHGPVAGG